jgi:hypothetical protein
MKMARIAEKLARRCRRRLALRFAIRLESVTLSARLLARLRSVRLSLTTKQSRKGVNAARSWELVNKLELGVLGI